MHSIDRRNRRKFPTLIEKKEGIGFTILVMFEVLKTKKFIYKGFNKVLVSVFFFFKFFCLVMADF
jgi:hypothetical protein